ncbi:unnamed protein product [Peniophora sp. CBMAI 1063]|nr:unnamed protein product [Peniophora sp. CBMAI 1063]
MRDPTYPLIPIANIVASVLLIATLVSNSHRGAYNHGVIMLEGWVLVQVLIMAIQSIVWRDSWEIKIPVFCDISSHLWQGSTIGIPACSFVITRRLWSAIHDGPEGRSERTCNGVTFDYLMGIGLPLLSMVLYYPVQGARFQVIENYGCSTFIFPSGVAFILLQSWLVILPLLSILLYGWRIIVYLYQHQRATSRILHQSGDIFERTHYTRIFALACVDVVLVLPLGIATIITGFPDGTQFWPGWDIVKQWWAPQTVADTEWRISVVWSFNIYWNQCSGVVLSIAIFLLFGLTKAARESYLKVFLKARVLGSPRSTSREHGPGATSSITLPTARAEMGQTDSLATVAVTKGNVRQAADLDTLPSGPEASPRALVVVDIEVGHAMYSLARGSISRL